jgi:glycolate oxidase FAD binding subunit
VSDVSSLVELLPPEALKEAPAFGGGIALGATPEAVVQPRSTEEVAATLAWASERGMGVLPIASGRRVRSRPLDRPFLVVGTGRLVGIERYESADLTLTASAGTPMTELERELGASRQWLPFDPPDVQERTLGGLVATGESGPAWMGFGELRNHVLGATIVTGDGRTLELGGRVVKNVAGFDLLRAVVGSRGRLGVITSVCMRVFPVPTHERVLFLTGSSVDDLTEVARSVGTAPVLPVSSVLVSPLPSLGAQAALLVRLHGAEATVEADQQTLESHCGTHFQCSAEPQALLRKARGVAVTGSPLLRITALPSSLGTVLSAIVDAASEAELFVDTYAGRVRALAPGLDVESLIGLRARISGLGGTMAVESGDEQGRDAQSRGGDAPVRSVRELVEGIEKVFDPAGVFWPCRP